jgi:TRAP-type C4-dicarboxylate transport system permease small subunit
VTRSPLPSGAQPAAGVLHRLEEAVLALLLSALIVMASLQILLRALFGFGIAWVDPMLRVGVLWVGLLGAVTASREGRQITVDVLSRLLSGRALAAAGAVTNLFSAAVAGAVAYHAARFVASEHAFGSVAFSGVPAAALASVIPFAFGAIALRYLGLGATDLRALVRGEGGGRPPDQAGAR